MTERDYSRFVAKIAADVSGCWIWTASRVPNGYGKFGLDGRTRAAHRLAYEYWIGQIPEGSELDHLCRTPACVNPTHLEPVSHQVNILRGITEKSPETRRKIGASKIGKPRPWTPEWRERLLAHCVKATHCKRGHRFDSANTYQRSDGGRMCLTCTRAAALRSYYRRNGEAVA